MHFTEGFEDEGISNCYNGMIEGSCDGDLARVSGIGGYTGYFKNTLWLEIYWYDYVEEVHSLLSSFITSLNQMGLGFG